MGEKRIRKVPAFKGQNKAGRSAPKYVTDVVAHNMEVVRSQRDPEDVRSEPLSAEREARPSLGVMHERYHKVHV